MVNVCFGNTESHLNIYIHSSVLTTKSLVSTQCALSQCCVWRELGSSSIPCVEIQVSQHHFWTLVCSLLSCGALVKISPLNVQASFWNLSGSILDCCVNLCLCLCQYLPCCLSHGSFVVNFEMGNVSLLTLWYILPFNTLSLARFLVCRLELP